MRLADEMEVLALWCNSCDGDGALVIKTEINASL